MGFIFSNIAVEWDREKARAQAFKRGRTEESPGNQAKVLGSSE